MTAYKKYCLFSVAGILLASFYPLYMGIKVVVDYIAKGSVDVADYPKYIIPYTPICLALIISVILMPLAIKFLKRFIPVIFIFALGLFFAFELTFENLIVMDGLTRTNIKNWQALMCFVTPEALRGAGDILLGQYSPAFKVHFYIISAIVILSVLNCVVGFALMIRSKSFERKKPLIVQAITAAIFVGLCIFACFTAFFRTGQIQVSWISAILMSAFFIIFGITFGVFVGSFFYKKRRLLSVIMPSLTAIATTAIMYIGELILLNGNLYRFGTGFFFESLGNVPLALADMAVILLSGIITYLVSVKINNAYTE